MQSNAKQDSDSYLKISNVHKIAIALIILFIITSNLVSTSIPFSGFTQTTSQDIKVSLLNTPTKTISAGSTPVQNWSESRTLLTPPPIPTPNVHSGGGGESSFSPITEQETPAILETLILFYPGYAKIEYDKFIDIEKHNLSGISVSNNYVSIEHDHVLNRPATITLFNISVSNPIIKRNGKICKDCNIINSSFDTITFRVSHFSSYTASANSQLYIWDDSDYVWYYPLQQVYFYANYTNITSNVSIDAASCNISFGDYPDLTMVYNPTSEVYEYNRSFPSFGTYVYNVTCDGTSQGFTPLSTEDTAAVTYISSITGADNITVEKTERRPANDPVDLAAVAGNLSELVINANSISHSWQGYYGNITGVIYLEDASGSVLYNWNITDVQGEIFATRTPEVNFATINCSTAGMIDAENTFLSLTASDADSVQNTFATTTHPEFWVGAEQIIADSCASTNTYVNDMIQTSTFHEILLSDNATNIIYTAIIEQESLGFNNRRYDFQMLVGENGHNGDNQVTPYYFYIEIS